MKKAVSILMVLLVTLLSSGCKEKARSYTDMKKDQKVALGKFLSDRGLEVLHKFPTNGKFGEKQFFLIKESGVYLHVIDPGNGERAKVDTTEILMRCSGEHIPTLRKKKKDTTAVQISRFDLFKNEFQPIAFKYKRAAIVAAQHAKLNDLYEFYLSESVESALEYVGNQSIVKMIVPFENGSSYQMTTGEPIYYEKIKFVFEE